jgi:Cu-Zn family superoxide dismutase
VRRLLLTAAVGLLAACATTDDWGEGGGPAVALLNATGVSVGTVEMQPRSGGTYIRVEVQGLPPGEHGLHLHAVGKCEGPAFQSAGAHWNPAARQHGHLNPQGAHLGDLPNLTVSANGNGRLVFLVNGDVSNDSDGTSLVVHAKPDDYRTDPSGNSGDRIACAVLAA